MAHAEVTTCANIGSAENRISDALDQPDIRSNGALRGSNFGQNRPDVRRVERCFRLAAQQMMHGVEMVTNVSDMRHRPDQAEMLSQFCQSRVKLRDLHTGYRRGNGL